MSAGQKKLCLSVVCSSCGQSLRVGISKGIEHYSDDG